MAAEALTPGSGAPAHGTYFLGRYRIVDEIGVGGMASVHLARADGPGGFQKWVAIKRIHSHLVEDDQFIHMFLDEARIAAQISHANVAQVFDLGKDDDSYWIAMEYLHGEPLREIMRQVDEGASPMGYVLVAKVIADAAEGLHAAHDLRGKDGELLNLVHRDVTPHNLFVTYEGTTKVVDFGVAKVAGRLSSTRAGTLKGKLAYMSPEQVRGQDIDRRTDIFALGVVLWELTTGHRLFRRDSDLETLEKVQSCVVPSPSAIHADYPAELESIVMRALAKNPEDRFQTAREFSRALQQYLLRAGVFVGPEEVSAYLDDTFKDRIRKRDAHLKWAAEVTQTINIQEFREQVAEGSGSHSQSAMRKGKRPSATMRTHDATSPSSSRSQRTAITERPPARDKLGSQSSSRSSASQSRPVPPSHASPDASAETAPLPAFGDPRRKQLPSAYDLEDFDDDEDVATVVANTRDLLPDLTPPAGELGSGGAKAMPPAPASSSSASRPLPVPAVPPAPASSSSAVSRPLASAKAAPAAAPSGPASLAQAAGASASSSQKAKVVLVVALIVIAVGGLILAGLMSRRTQDAPVGVPLGAAKPGGAKPEDATKASAKPAGTKAAGAASAPSHKDSAPTSGDKGKAKADDKSVSPSDLRDDHPAEKKPEKAAPKGPPGTLSIVCVPACTSVVAGGRVLGPSPAIAKLPPGPVVIRLFSPGRKPQLLRRTIASGRVTAARVPMPRLLVSPRSNPLLFLVLFS